MKTTGKLFYDVLKERKAFPLYDKGRFRARSNGVFVVKVKLPIDADNVTASLNGAARKHLSVDQVRKSNEDNIVRMTLINKQGTKTESFDGEFI